MGNLKDIQDILRNLLELERNLQLKDFSFLEDLKRSILNLDKSSEPDVKILAKFHVHLKPEMTAREISNIIVPFERFLNRNITDAEILVTSQDEVEKSSHPPLPLVVVLDHLRSAFNVGSILRTSECLKISHVHLCGYTATPENEKTLKAAMGVETWIPWSHHESTADCLKKLKQEGYHLIALETAAGAKAWDEPILKKPTALILGNERFGLESSLLSLCDEMRVLPQRGQKNSLNVANAAAIFMYEWYRQWK